MNYSINGILILLQDLQRIYFGKVSVYVDTILLDDGAMVACCVFDRGGEPHTTNFYNYESDERRKENYIKVLELVNENAA